MTLYEIATGYTSVPAKVGAATEIVVEELTKAFINNSIDVKIIDMADENRLETELPIIEVKIPSVFASEDTSLGIVHKMKRVVYSVKLAKKLKSIIKSSDEKIILHFHNQYNIFFFLMLSTKNQREKCFIAYTNHSGIWSVDLEKSSQILKKRYFQEAYALKKADIVFFLNKQMLENAVKYLKVPSDRFVCVSNGVNTEIYHPLSEPEKTKAKEKFGFENKKVFLQVGSVYDNKGQKKTVKILAPFLKSHPDCVFAYAGGIVSQEYQQRIFDLAKKEGIESQVKYLRIIPPGEKLNELYNCAQASFLVSDYEGFPLIIAESLSAGVPVLLEKNSPFEVGDGCIQIDEESFESTAELLLNNSDITKLTRANAVNNLSWDAVAKEYIKYFFER